MNKTKFQIFNGPTSGKAKGWLKVTNEASSESADILIYDQIGKDWWSNDGVNAKDFAEALKEIPTTKNINVRINSPGGNVWDGLAIYHQLQARKDRVTCIVDGIAASIASVIAMAGKETKMPKNALLMMHDPSGMCIGTADEMRAMADVLEKNKDVIAGVYADKTGKPLDEIKKSMTDETWFTGDEAKDFGLVDTVTEEKALAANFDLSGFRRAPKAFAKQTPEQTTPDAANSGGANERKKMNRERIIALLNKHGIKVEDKATDEQLLVMLDTIPAQNKSEQVPANTSAIDGLKAEVDALKTANANEKKDRITKRVNELAPNRIPANQIQNWVNRAIADETVLNDLAALPVNLPGVEPVTALVDVVSDSIQDIQKHVLENFGKRVDNIDVARNRGQQRAAFINKHMAKLQPVLNTNTVSSDLKRVVILQDVIRAFARRLLPLRAFSTVFNGVPLEGTDEVVVPYFALDTSSSTDFVAANGYDTFGNTNSDSKKVTVDKRKYQSLKFSSSEFRRQPYMDIARGVQMKAEKLAADVFADVLSIVTIANYSGTALVSGIAASAFDSESVTDIRTRCFNSDWPDAGRSLILDSAYYGNLLKDGTIKNSFNDQLNQSAVTGQVPRLQGFDLYECSRIPDNSEKLEGMAVYMSALLVATAPIEPTAEVRNQLTSYEVIVDPQTGIAFEYRRWGNPDKDETREVIEVNYGRAKGEAAALKRLVSP